MYKHRRKDSFLFDEQAIVPIKNRFSLDLSRFGGFYRFGKRNFSEIIIWSMKPAPWNASLRLQKFPLPYLRKLLKSCLSLSPLIALYQLVLDLSSHSLI